MQSGLFSPLQIVKIIQSNINTIFFDPTDEDLEVFKHRYAKIKKIDRRIENEIIQDIAGATKQSENQTIKV